MDDRETTNRLLTILERVLEIRQLPLPLKAADQEPPSDPPHHFTFEDFNDYASFRAFWQAREREVALEGLKIQRKTLTGKTAGDSEKSLKRGMDRFHLTKRTGERDYWPPSTWPEQEPPPKKGPGTISRLPVLAGTLASARLIATPCLLHLHHHLLH